MLEENSIQDQIDIVAQPWAESPYYEDAEDWTDLFWNKSTQFRKLFDQMDHASTLELACGYGRHAERAIEMCDSYIAMDIFEKNLQKTAARMIAHADKFSTRLGDGSTFKPLADNSLTCIYCYDAMVHFSPDIVRSYLFDAARVLRTGGRILLHHSNYEAPVEQHYGLNPHARNHMTFPLFKQFCSAAGLEIVESISMPWGDIDDLDRLSLVQA